MSSLSFLLAALFLMAIGTLLANFLQGLPVKTQSPQDEQATIEEAIQMVTDVGHLSSTSHRPRSRRVLSPQTEMPARQELAKTSTFRKRLTKTQKQLVLQRFGWRCAGCRKALLEQWDPEFVHIIPLAAVTGPASKLTWQLNHVHAFQPMCRRCHGYKCYKERQQGLYNRHLLSGSSHSHSKAVAKHPH